MSLKILSVIATFNRLDLLKLTLSSIEQCKKPDNYQGVLIIENGSSVGIKEIVDSFSFKIQYAHLPVANKSAALNEGIRLVDPETLLYFHDDDIRLSPNAITAMSEAAEQTVGAAFFGGPVSTDYEDKPADWLLPELPASAIGFQQDSDSLAQFTGKAFLGCNWSAVAKDIVAVGGFNQSLGPQDGAPPGEDWQIQSQLKNAGLTPFYVPAALSYHYVPKERCSTEWALMRKFRDGLSAGALEADSLKTWRRLIRSYISWRRNALMTTVIRLRHGEQQSFTREIKTRWSEGYFKGMLRKPTA